MIRMVISKKQKMLQGGKEDMFAAISLIACLVVIVLGFVTKKNIGVIAIAAALILGRIAGIADNDIIACFPLSLFINISGIFFFFAIADVNNTLQLLSKKLLLKLPKNKKVFPILAMLVVMVLASVDAGGYAIFTLTPMITMSLALFMDVDIIMMGIMTVCAAALSAYSPISGMGIAMANIAAGSGYTGIAKPLFLNAIILFGLLGLFMYVIFGGFRNKTMNYAATIELDTETPPFNKEQKIVLAAIVVLILFIMITGINPGLTAYAFGIVLLMLNVADEKVVFKAVPWHLIIMITGFGLLMGLTRNLGGVDLLAGWLSSFLNKYIAAPVLSLTSSFMSMFTLAIAGPIPALTPTLSAISQSLGGSVSELKMLLSIYLGGMAATISPLSLGGAVIIASYNTIMKPSAAESNRIFNKLLLMAIIGSLFAAVIAGTGIYDIIG